MVEYVLERFLFRLGASPLGREHFILKGGLLLAQFGARRMTRDIDILGHAFPGEEAEIIRRIAAIATTEVDDGVAYDSATLRPVPIREEDEYHGLRLSMAASIARARLKLQLDTSLARPSSRLRRRPLPHPGASRMPIPAPRRRRWQAVTCRYRVENRGGTGLPRVVGRRASRSGSDQPPEREERVRRCRDRADTAPNPRSPLSAHR
ncbi:nucleotidyl transferase AbiEii/AbiGii toxin family protein [Streptomyces sp. NBC_00887]|uniref:nucleotidyl transferase AbiEii/AbiGii toxin family protein n=1 Tax=Streptomyces sp. NBC_00887 TaxID=2975859 RepID=UPI0038673E28|nr:nucleotidyl transferase AbiEii/AbiGii toxin family protein [Streptomyces sp. NBC_00887]